MEYAIFIEKNAFECSTNKVRMVDHERSRDFTQSSALEILV